MNDRPLPAKPAISLCESDYVQLAALAAEASAPGDGSALPRRQLGAQLALGTVVPLHRLSRRTVRLSSSIALLDTETDELDRFTLCLPSEADAGKHRVSVLTPVGMAVLGLDEGDEFFWDVPGGRRHLRILRVAQAKLPSPSARPGDVPAGGCRPSRPR